MQHTRVFIVVREFTTKQATNTTKVQLSESMSYNRVTYRSMSESDRLLIEPEMTHH